MCLSRKASLAFYIGHERRDEHTDREGGKQAKEQHLKHIDKGHIAGFPYLGRNHFIIIIIIYTIYTHSMLISRSLFELVMKSMKEKRILFVCNTRIIK